jgi:hypothetical protein
MAETERVYSEGTRADSGRKAVEQQQRFEGPLALSGGDSIDYNIRMMWPPVATRSQPGPETMPSAVA